MNPINMMIIFSLAMTFINAKPSWCSNARQYVDKRICANPELSEYDYVLSEVYGQARNRVSAMSANALKKDERYWIKERNSVCHRQSDTCIKRYFVNRIHYLKNYGNNSAPLLTQLGKKGKNEPPIIKQLKNATYDGKKLKDGEWNDGNTRFGHPFEESIRFVSLLLSGDLNGDGNIEYVARTALSGWGGSGTFHSMNIMSKRGNKLVYLDSADLGDRTEILSKKIKNGNIILKIKDHGSNDGMARPHRIRTHIWQLRGNHLKKIQGHKIF